MDNVITSTTNNNGVWGPDGEFYFIEDLNYLPKTSKLLKSTTCANEQQNFKKAALYWFEFGFPVIPITPGTKKTACKWDLWLKGLCKEKIRSHWTKHPNHEVGFIVGDDIIVFDADTPEAVKAIYRIEEEFEVEPTLVVKTEKGEHHFFRKEEGIIANTCGHGSDPEQKIDIKTGRTMVILPPSGNKRRIVKLATKTKDLPAAEQWLVNAVYLIIGKSTPDQPKQIFSEEDNDEIQSVSIGILEVLVNFLDPDCPYQEWFSIVAAIYNSTGGSEEGFNLADKWSGKGLKYKGSEDIVSMWKSLRQDVTNPITIATIIKKVQELGIDTSNYFLGFEIEEYTIAGKHNLEDGEDKVETKPEKKVTYIGPFEKFSVTGTSGELERKAAKQVCVLGKIAACGQISILCGEANSGKTLITFRELTKSIEDGRIDPKKLFYLNMDDNYNGLIEKLKIAEKYGSFNMLAEGHKGFRADDFIRGLEDYIKEDQARGVVIILDTLKKFVDVMNKSDCRNFNAILRQFSAKGGTVIALAHTNKQKGADGKAIFGGVSDLKDDCDCMYILSPRAEVNTQNRIVQLENVKNRGSVVDNTSYCFEKKGTNGSYNDLFLSVHEVDEEKLTALKQHESLRTDGEIINIVIACINKGINTKGELKDALAKEAEISKSKAINLIEKYTGSEPEKHRWNFTVQGHGKNVFAVLESADND